MSVVQPGINDVKTLYPELCEEWHPDKNGALKPENVAAKSHKRIWWRCSIGHEWEAMVSNRTEHGRGCPYCAGQRPIVGENDLETVNPKLAQEWNYDKNQGLTPHDITAGSNKKVWWKCKDGHEWQAIVKLRNKGAKCPYCPNSMTVIVTHGVNDFASRYPELAKEWHPTKNAPLTAEDVSFASGKKAWWICKNGHEYQMIIGNKAKGRRCPVCSRRRRTSFPEQAFFYYLKKAYPDAINSYKDIFSGGMELDIYIPSIRMGVEYDGRLFHRKTDNVLRDARKYKICKENGIQLVRIMDINDSSFVTRYDRVIRLLDPSEKVLQNAICELLYHLGKLSEVDVNIERDRYEILEYLGNLDKSLATEIPEIAAECSNTRNGKLTASIFHPGSNERVWWKCSKCGHEWKAAINSRTGEGKNGCPVCAKQIGGVKHHEYVLREKGSFAENYPDLLERWNYEKNSVLPTEVVSGSARKVWWKCEKGHEWEATLEHVSKRGCNCPFCSNKRILAGYNDLATVNPNLAMEWDHAKNENMTPSTIGAGSSKKAWWICSKCGNSWQAVIHTRNKGTGCPACDRLRKIGNQYARRK